MATTAGQHLSLGKLRRACDGNNSYTAQSRLGQDCGGTTTASSASKGDSSRFRAFSLARSALTVLWVASITLRGCVALCGFCNTTLAPGSGAMVIFELARAAAAPGVALLDCGVTGRAATAATWWCGPRTRCWVCEASTCVWW